MTFEIWAAYVLAYTAISLIPGPSVLMVIGQTLSHGRRAALICIAGDLLGGLIVMIASYAGLGLILASSAKAFAIVKWAGVTYMAWLGLAQIRAARGQTAGTGAQARATRSARHRQSFRAGLLTGLLNPKAILFYMAFLSQFITPDAPQLPQFLTLMTSSTVIVGLVLSGYVGLAARVRAGLQRDETRRGLDYAGGAFLLGGQRHDGSALRRPALTEKYARMACKPDSVPGLAPLG